MHLYPSLEPAAIVSSVSVYLLPATNVFGTVVLLLYFIS